jgi:hypothetical protein
LSRKFDNSLIIQLKASAQCGWILLALHTGATVCVSVASAPWPIKAAVWTALVASLYHGIRAHAVRVGSRPISALLLEPDGELSVRVGAHADWRPCHIVSKTVCPVAVLLRLRRAGARLPFSVVVTADAVEPTIFRQLRARLRLGSAAA